MTQFSIGLGDFTTQGIVYVLTNQAMPDIVKIGCTSKEDIKYRLKELDNTSVPLPFECYCAYVIQNGNMKKVETALHHAFGGLQ